MQTPTIIPEDYQEQWEALHGPDTTPNVEGTLVVESLAARIPQPDEEIIYGGE